jgi:GT2 family glycosyltransferase/SAM-dependent methyltransferase
MGELIRRERAAAPLGFSGERLTAATTGQVEIEHYHRYLLAREFCRGKDVLDIASGEGYGAALLAQVARTAIGVEIDPETVQAARREFQRPNLRYEQGDARAIPLPDASIDVAVSFETLEHLVEHDAFLGQLARVLRPGGLLIISTPDRDVYSAGGVPPNPYHVLELTRPEFHSLLSRHFAHAETVAQRSLIGSVILGASNAEPILSFEKRSDAVIEGSRHLARAPYLVAFASNAPLPPVPGSVYVHRSDIDTDSQVRFDAEIARRHAEQRAETAEARIAAAEAEAADLQTAVARQQHQAAAAHALAADQHQQIAAAVAEIKRLNQRAEDLVGLAERRLQLINETTAALDAQRARADNAERRLAHEAAERHQTLSRLHALELSTAWRITWPLRRASARFPTLARTLRRGAKLAWYAGTLQLPRRYRLWRDHRALLLAGPPVPLQLAAPAPAAPAEPTINPASIRIPIAGAPASRPPDVSIVIATYGQLQATLACLKSIADHPSKAAIEVILIDDAYPGPEDMTVLRHVQGLEILRNARNLGFLLSCNHAARSARGRYIHLLNNDTELTPGAIDALVDLLDSRPDAGMAGSKLLYPDGTLQEAGGILWTDASGWNYGKRQDPNRPEYNYVRQVDYCSGASIMVRRPLWEALGGFDEAFIPAYYEDADLAFRIRAAGAQVLYEPRSVVIHHEGLSHGTDTGAGVKAHQVANQARMVAKWADTLAREHFANADNVLRARDRARTRKTILVIDHYAPEPDRDAGSRSTMGILTSLLDAGWVVKFWPHNRIHSDIYTTALERLGIEVLDSRTPYPLGHWLHDNGASLDHVMAIRPDIAVDVLQHIMRNTGAVLSFYGVDLHFARVRRQAVLDDSPALLAEAATMERLERRIWRQFDVVIYPSDEEAEVVRTMAPGAVARGIIPFTFDASPPRAAPPEAGNPDARTILFVAGFAHPPNVDAALFLMTEIIPALIARIGTVKVVLAGSNPTDAVKALAAPDVEVTGYLTDEALSALYARYRAAVVPLRFGAGVKGKVVEALSRGLPVVTTSIGAQGIPGLADVVPVHDDPISIVQALETLMTDDAAWLAQSHRQTDFAERRFSRVAMQRSILAALEAGETAAHSA